MTILVEGPRHDGFLLDTTVFALEVFRHWFDRRLAPREDTRAQRLNVRGRIVVTVMIIGVIGALALAVAADRSFHLDTATWNERGAAVALVVQFVMVRAAARKELRVRAVYVNGEQA